MVLMNFGCFAGKPMARECTLLNHEPSANLMSPFSEVTEASTSLQESSAHGNERIRPNPSKMEGLQRILEPKPMEIFPGVMTEGVGPSIVQSVLRILH